MHTPDVASFYHLRDDDPTRRLCRGLACFVARGDDPVRWKAACDLDRRVYCLGRCYLAPAQAADTARPHVGLRTRDAVIVGRLGDMAAPTLDRYRAQGGYQGLARALRQRPEAVLDTIEQSGLRGRGGAGFPVGRKWRAVFAQPGPEKVVVANADEGDPGAYIDRLILEDNPHGVLEALAIAAHAVGAIRGCIYVRAEYPEAARQMAAAIDEARAAGLLGAPGHGAASAVDVELVSGLGSYVCGEETALLNAVEGRRPEVRARPPYPAVAGLGGRPTLVQNVETLAAVPWIVEQGADAYHRLGFSSSRGTKVFSLNSLFHRPGLYEVEFGLSVRQLVEELGGGLRSGTLKGVIIGGPLAGVIPPSLLDTPVGFEELNAIGASVGHGGVVAFDERTSIAALVHHVFDFGAFESCGKCTPCRLGARRIEEIFGRIVTSGLAPAGAHADWIAVRHALAQASLCGHGTGLADFAASIARYFASELEPCFVS